MITGGETEDEKVRVDILENQAIDFRNGFVRICYTDLVSFFSEKYDVSFSIPTLPLMPTSSLSHQDKLKPGYLEELPDKLKQFSDFLGDRKWFAGDKVGLA